MLAAGCEFEMRVSPRQGQEHPLVSLVIVEPTDLPQPDAIAVEGDDLR
jgi:hypothetical protein